MKVKEDFARRVLREGQVITPNYLYFSEKLNSALEGSITIVYRTRNNSGSALFYKNRLSITSYEIIGAYTMEGEKI